MSGFNLAAPAFPILYQRLNDANHLKPAVEVEAADVSQQTTCTRGSTHPGKALAYQSLGLNSMRSRNDWLVAQFQPLQKQLQPHDAALRQNFLHIIVPKASWSEEDER